MQNGAVLVVEDFWQGGNEYCREDADDLTVCPGKFNDYPSAAAEPAVEHGFEYLTSLRNHGCSVAVHHTMTHCSRTG